MKAKIELGSLVLSLSGHDSGTRFAVIEIIDEDYVLVADGRLRTLAKPKKKKLKHLQPLVGRLDIAGLKGASAWHDKAVRDFVKIKTED